MGLRSQGTLIYFRHPALFGIGELEPNCGTNLKHSLLLAVMTTIKTRRQGARDILPGGGS